MHTSSYEHIQILASSNSPHAYMRFSYFSNTKLHKANTWKLRASEEKGEKENLIKEGLPHVGNLSMLLSSFHNTEKKARREQKKTILLEGFVVAVRMQYAIWHGQGGFK